MGEVTGQGRIKFLSAFGSN